MLIMVIIMIMLYAHYYDQIMPIMIILCSDYAIITYDYAHNGNSNRHNNDHNISIMCII